MYSVWQEKETLQREVASLELQLKMKMKMAELDQQLQLQVRFVYYLVLLKLFLVVSLFNHDKMCKLVVIYRCLD